RPVLSQAAPTAAALNGIYSSGPAKCADREPTPPTSEIGCSPSIIYGDMLAECTLIDHASLQVDSEPMHALTRNSIGDDMAHWTSTRFNDSQDAGSVREWTTNDTTASSPAPYTPKRSSMPSVARDFSLEDLVNGTVAHQPLAESLNDYPTLGYEPIACNADLEPRYSPTHSDDDYIGRRQGSPDEGLTDDMSNTPPTTTQLSHISSPTEVSQPQRTPSNEHSPKARACCRYDQRSAARNLEPCSREKALLDVDVGACAPHSRSGRQINKPARYRRSLSPGQPMETRVKKRCVKQHALPKHTRRPDSPQCTARTDVASSRPTARRSPPTGWTDEDDTRLLQLRNENELTWKRIADVYFVGTDQAWLRARCLAKTGRTVT
ncbi:hypothetical protein LTR02_017897, partial [Friedmanniomyces endolithicus]